ncbi:DUF2207 family protein [Microbacterium xylanilyticum]
MRARPRARLRALLCAAALAFAPMAFAPPAQADANAFSYQSWDSRFELSRGADGRADLAVTETLVADFPDFDQNHGIIRGLPMYYDGAPLQLHLVSITDGSGKALPYDDGTTEDGVRQIKIGDEDVFQHGPTTYVIRYTMRDVVHRPVDQPIDEWYWNLLPLDSSQFIQHFRAEIAFAPDVRAAMTGAHACYTGEAGATTRCDLTGGPDHFSVAQENVVPGTGVTVAFAMKKGTFAPAPARVPDPLTDTVPYPVAGGGAALALFGTIFGVAAMRGRARRRGRGIVVAQYDVPTSLPPLLAAVIEGKKAVSTSAEIVHLAVRKAIRIEEGTIKPVLHLQDATTVPDPLDAQTLSTLFPSGAVGSSRDLSAPDDALVKKLRALPGTAAIASVQRGLLTRRRSVISVVCSVLGLALGVAGIVLAVPGMAVGRLAAIGAFVLAIVFAAIAVVAFIAALIPYAVLTPAGAEAREYLLGVKEYIRLAEADRIRMLQSYTGAERRRDGTVDVIVLYEHLLPYAMLFGMEREWGDVLTVHYQEAGTGPDWYTGFAAGNLSSSLSGVGSSLTGTSTPSSSSSGSTFSGSSGGGFSGGGGGGGSSGGW